jgi:hypothetical protein
MNSQQMLTIVFDDGGDSILCQDTTLAHLTKSAALVSQIRVGTLVREVTMPMWEFIRALEAIREFTRGDHFPHLCCDVSDAYDELRSSSRLRVLSGLSPDESTLFLVFASPGRRACIAQAKTGNQERPKTEA